MTNPNFSLALTAWLEAVKTLVLDPQININHNDPVVMLETDDGKKFVRIVSVGQGAHNRSAWAFVAKEDGSSKAMGQWKAGDIFKSGGWKAPAKHARGNIFDLSNGPTCNVTSWTGPNYLRG